MRWLTYGQKGRGLPNLRVRFAQQTIHDRTRTNTKFVSDCSCYFVDRFEFRALLIRQVGEEH